MIHYSLADESVELSKYPELPKATQPTLILGSVIKHKYDEERLSFNNKDITTIKIGNTVIKGVVLEPKPDSNIDLLFAQLKVVDDNNLIPSYYEKMLQSFGISSSECYGMLKPGIYPVNGDCIIKLSKLNSNILHYYEQFFNEQTECSWQKFSYLALFIVFNKS